MTANTRQQAVDSTRRVENVRSMALPPGMVFNHPSVYRKQAKICLISHDRAIYGSSPAMPVYVICYVKLQTQFLFRTRLT
jgi:hypothetical protein